ncbi:MAG: hypothetical protein HQM12_09015 [SAR324 cluster bacterium]|nr:hypothetical protein [SAR324 cluster bacterium]
MMKHVALIIAIGFLLYGCAVESDAKAIIDVSPGTVVVVGTIVTFDAEKSDYEKIEWFRDGVTLGECKNKSKCPVLARDVGQFVIKASVKVEAHQAMGTSVEKSEDEAEITITVLSE